MTDEPAQPEDETSDPSRERAGSESRERAGPESRERARVEPTPAAKKTDLLPILYLVGFVVLAGAMYFLWQNPPEAKLAAQDAGKVQTLEAQVGSLHDDVAKLEQQKPAPSGPTTAEFQDLQKQVAAVASKPSASPADTKKLSDEVQTLQQQVAALSSKPEVAPAQLAQLAQQVQGMPQQPANLQPLQQRIDALEKRPQFDPASLDPKFQQVTTEANDKVQQLASKTEAADNKLSQSVNQLQSQVEDLGKQQQAIAQKTRQEAKLQGVAAALAVGQKLGPIPGAPPALARFENQAPPTEASLRQSFDQYAADAERANQPVINQNQDFASRLWARAQQAVTVRQGDHVLVGDPIAGILAHAKEQLNNGNLEGAVGTVNALTGPAAKAVQPWLDQAHALLDARAAIASMAAG